MSTITLPNDHPLSGLLRLLAGARARWLMLAFLLLAGGAIVFASLHARTAVAYTTAVVTQGSLVQSVTASGVVNPQNDVSVGSQVSGTIASIAVDFNSKVKQGQVLARLDPRSFQAQLSQAQAALQQAQAQVAQADANVSGAASGTGVASADARAQQAAVAAAQANVEKAKAAADLAQTTLTRDSALLSQGYIAQSAVDADRSNAAQDAAGVAAAEASVAQAQAQAQAGAATVNQNGSTQAAQAASAQAAQANVAAAQAVVQQDELNLEHSVITSPVNGTVVARDVSVGQTVAASLQTPTLFSIAQDLGKMEVDINVGEPDIGNVKPGDRVSFSVLAYPTRTFHGVVSQVRINPQTIDNVVTYDVVVLVENHDGALLPGMTANASIDVASARGALVVPISALQWSPTATAGGAGAAAATPWGAASGGAGAAAITAGSSGAVFVQRGNALQRVPVTVSLVTPTQAAVIAQTPGTLNAGDAVVLASSGAVKAGRPGSGRPPVAAAAMRGLH
jgi:HlyD family secretion protein